MMNFKWNSVDDSLPEIERDGDVWVVVVFDNGSCETATVSDWLINRLCEFNCKITHWMPLPDLPECS